MASEMELPNAHRISLFVVTAVFTILGTCIVCLRLYVRKFIVNCVGHDDYFILAALVCSIGFTAASIVGMQYGVGKHSFEVNTINAADSIKATFYVEIFYYLSIYLIKMSILFCYRRLNATLKDAFYQLTMASMVLITFHFISTMVVCFLQCRPISFYWDQKQAGQCINITAFFYSTNIFTIITDIIILALPIHTLTKIQRTSMHKVALFVVFLAGGLSTISSCVRLNTIRVYTLSSDAVYDAAPINLWSFIEINLGLACACGPALKKLLSCLSLLPSNRSKDTNPEAESEPEITKSQARILSIAVLQHQSV
ncbi:hypothetical protein BP6252_02533 [Coleophoma cylindrospora]|uniref:Rhodopsin domain-containing protein n=1 Tax=Coleophoma cylindrospora TaxID=1849047 RepID=A0A3D8SF76_9HELO|nr:hypothetical protein BP6252_02533 [Coleophoma cylindrospora]